MSTFFIHINNFQFSIPNNYGNNDSIPFLYFLLRIIKGCLVAPIIEELFFRNFIQKKLNEIYPAIYSIFGASLLFSLYHFDLSNILPALLLGIILGIVFYKSKNIKYAIYLHSVSNFLIYSISYYWQEFDVFFNQNKFNIFYWTTILIGLLILYLSLKAFIQKNRKSSNLNFYF